MPVTRRKFLKYLGWGLLGLIAAGGARYLRQFFSPEPPQKRESEDEKPTPKPEEKEEDRQDAWLRPLGATGETVSLLGLGGGAIIARSWKKEQALALIEKALDMGVNYIDTAPTYGSGTSEEHIGEAVEGCREEVFLATKTLNRSYDGTMRLVEESLQRLRTDYLDLYQIHGIGDRDDAERCLVQDGAYRALRKLKEQEVVRHIGLTGHRNPDPLRFMLERRNFDCVLIPLNPAEVHFNSFKDGMVDLAEGRDMGIIAMKVAAYGRLLKPDGITMKQSLRYVGSLPVSTAIVGHSSLRELEENVETCREFEPLTPQEMSRLEGVAESYQEEANFYKRSW